MNTSSANKGCFRKPKCRHADITTEPTPTCRANNYCNVLNRTVVYCRLKGKVIPYYFETCPEYEEQPIVTLDGGAW